MEDLKSRVAYLKGLAEGLKLDESDKEGKILLKIIDVLEGVAEEVDQMKTDYDELLEYTEAIDEDLTDLEDEYYEDDDDDEDEDDDDDEDDDNDDDDDDEHDNEGFTIECPNCRELVVVADDLLDNKEPIKVTCPGCGEAVLIDDDDDWEDDELPEDFTPEEKEEKGD